MNYKDSVVEKLKNYTETQIIITEHAKFQACFRNIDLEEVKRNIQNPEKLYFAGKQEALHKNEERYDCYFGYSNTRCQRYVLVFNKNCVVCTVIKINRRWQKRVEKRYAKI